MSITKELLDFLREQYPEGSRIKLREMKDDPAPAPPGTMGTLDHIDDAGHFHMKWDNGRTLSLIAGQDSFTVLPPDLTTMKLYMPLTADLYAYDENGDLGKDRLPLGDGDICSFEHEIREALDMFRDPEEAERGIMQWYNKNDGISHNVKSIVFTAERRDNRLWGVAECQVQGSLTPEEMTTLKKYISGQASDGWGEGFEQREIRIDEGHMFVHLWNGDNWDIQTEEERFAPKIAQGLPEMCFSVQGLTGELVCIKRGDPGFYMLEDGPKDILLNGTIAKFLNEQLGVTEAQHTAMVIGSMHGWVVPGADPATHQKDESVQMGVMTLE